MSADPHRPSNSEFVRKALAPLMKEDSHFHIDYHAQSSPYRQPVRFVDKKLKVRRALDRFEAKAMSPNSQHPTSVENSHPSPPNRYQTLRVRPVSGRQYKRWMRKTSVHPREEVPGEIVIDRWPECRKYIPGATTWTSPSHRIETLGPLVDELNEALEADQANHQKEGDTLEGRSNTFYLTEEEKRAIHEIRTKLLRTMALCYAEYGSGVEKAEEDHLIELVAQQLTESQANHFLSPIASPPSSSTTAVHPPSSHHGLLYISHEEEAPGLRHSPKTSILPLQRLSPFEYKQFKLQHQLAEEEEAGRATALAERESHHVIEDSDQHDFEEKGAELKESTEPIPVLSAGEDGVYEEDFVPQEETVPRRLEEDFANALAISLDLRAPSESNSAMGETLYSEEAYSQEGYEQPAASASEEKDLSPKLQSESSLHSNKHKGEDCDKVEQEVVAVPATLEKDDAVVGHDHDAEREKVSAADDEACQQLTSLPMDTDNKQPLLSPPIQTSITTTATTEEVGLIEGTIAEPCEEGALESTVREAEEEASVEAKQDITSRVSDQEGPATSSGNNTVGTVKKEETLKEDHHQVERGANLKMPAFLLAELKAPRALKMNAVALPTKKGVELEDARRAKVAEHKRKMAVFSSFLSRMERLKIPQIALQLLTRQDLLGRGKFAAVFRGRLAVASLKEPQEQEMKDEVVAGNGREMVAVKTVFSFLSRQKQPEILPAKDLAVKMAQYNVTSVSAPPVGVVEEFERELIALHAMRHENNIVHCLGFCREPLGIVFELIEGHDLFVSLHDPVWQGEVDEAVRWQLFMEIVQGVKAMHERGYIHRDLKPHNILIQRLEKSGGKSQFHAKIADLGSSRRLAPGEKLHDAVGTSGYVAPEVVSEGGAGYDFPADIFSCGVILWELLQREEGRLSNPFTGLSPIDFYNQMKQGLRPPFHNAYHTRQEVQRLLLNCWAFDPAGRPSATLVLRLARILSHPG